MQPCIVGVYQTTYAPARPEVSLEEMIYLAVQLLLAETGVSPQQIDHVATASSDGLDGRAISPMVNNASVGGYGQDIIHSSSSGEHALVLACLRIRSGRSRMVLVANWAKASEAPVPALDVLELEPFYHRRLQVERTAFLALQASAYLHRYRIDPRAAAAVVMKSRAAAARGPRARGQAPVSEEQVLAAPFVAWPLRQLDVPTPVDGVVAMLVADEGTARALGRPYARVDGLNWATDSYWLGDRPGSDLPSVTRAGRGAFARAGIRNPAQELDVIELCDLTSYHEWMVCEGLGLCEPGQGPALSLGGRTAPDGDLPVNPSGGLQAAFPGFASGLDRVAEVFRQVTGTAGAYQVAGTRRGLAHATAGLGCQANSVFILTGGTADA